MATGSKLVIVESPTKARKIGGYLGSDYTVMASVGHIRDLAQPSQVPSADKAKFGKFGVDVEDGFKPYYIVDGDKKKTVSELKSALKRPIPSISQPMRIARGRPSHGIWCRRSSRRCRSSAWCSTRSRRRRSRHR